MPAASELQLLAVMFDARLTRWIVWGGLIVLTIALLILMRTRWGQSNPLRKCVVLSLVAHLLLGIYTTTVNIVTGGRGFGDAGPMRVSLAGPSEDDSENQEDEAPSPWDDVPLTAPSDDQLPADTQTPPEIEVDSTPVVQSSKVVPLEITAAPPVTNTVDRAQPKPAAPIEAPQPTRTETQTLKPDQPEPNPEAELPLVEIDPSQLAPVDLKEHSLDAIAAIPSKSRELSDVNLNQSNRAPPAAIPGPDPFDPTSAKTSGSGTATASTVPKDPNSLPSIYELRVSPDKTRAAIGHGGTPDTEAAVEAALRWLAAHQSANGRWDGRRLEAGREAAIEGQERRGAGTRADTGITGLSLLAFLASGNTQLKGEHSKTVARGLEYLLSIQAADGNLGGDATLYEKMYCHAMATFALSEAYAMTHDERLQAAVRRAINYTLASQHPVGGRRYQPHEQGDTSQLGWQFMALKSAELAGIPIPAETREGMIRFLKTVSSGKHGGLASYRPGHAVSRPMTAEALVCRQFLGMARSNPASDEAGDYVLQELPGQRMANFYYWYYGTLAMYQLQGEHWKQWNEAIQNTLVGTQRVEGDQAGSWDPDPIWGAYGGRAYSTALGALCLEVYYRYLPFYIEAGGRDREQK